MDKGTTCSRYSGSLPTCEIPVFLRVWSVIRISWMQSANILSAAARQAKAMEMAATPPPTRASITTANVGGTR